jgi:AcrR family transcriptional regulator
MTKVLSVRKDNARRKPKLAGDKIRSTARDLFYRQGIRAVGVDEIVNAAGVTKPSLYRTFPSKDDLVAACLRDRGDSFLRRFETAMSRKGISGARGEFRKWLRALAVTATQPSYRGCGVTNAAVEYPDRNHVARKEALAIKTAFRNRLRRLARDLGARDPDDLADALMLLMEGSYVTGQLFGRSGPPRVVARTADALIGLHLRKV